MSEAPPDISKRARRPRDASANTGKSTGRENLRPWRPGESGNPTGRRKTRPVTEAITAALRAPYRGDTTNLQQAVANLMRELTRARGRDLIEAFKLVMQYTDGLPVQVVEVDVYEQARIEAERRGLDPEKVVSILDGLRARRGVGA